MRKKCLVSILIGCAAGFGIWIAGELVLVFGFPESGMTAAKVWAITVFAGTCLWNILRVRHIEKKQREDERNENYKGVY